MWNAAINHDKSLAVVFSCTVVENIEQERLKLMGVSLQLK
jgi:hypothetical protein